MVGRWAENRYAAGLADDSVIDGIVVRGICGYANDIFGTRLKHNVKFKQVCRIVLLISWGDVDRVLA